MNVFEAQGIRKTYGETKAVDGVDLSLAAGEIVTVLGHNRHCHKRISIGASPKQQAVAKTVHKTSSLQQCAENTHPA